MRTAPRALVALLLALLTLPAAAKQIDFAGNDSCSVVAGDVSCATVAGRGTLIIEAQTTHFTELRDAICANNGYQSQIRCTPALVASADCTAGQLGALVTNPQTCAEFAVDWIAETLRAQVRATRRSTAVTAAEAGVDTYVDIGDPAKP